MAYLEEMINKIFAKRQEGMSDEEIIRNESIPAATYAFYCVHWKKAVDRTVRNRQGEVSVVLQHIPITPKMRIEEAIHRGITHRKEISTQTGLPYNQVCALIAKQKLLPKKMEQTCAALASAHARGLTEYEAAQELSLSRAYIKKISQESGISFSTREMTFSRNLVKQATHHENLRYSHLCKMARRGLSTVQIGKRLHVTSERARQILHEENLYVLWEKSRVYYRMVQPEEKQEARALKDTRAALCALLRNHLNAQLASSHYSWAEKRTAEYVLNREERGANSLPSGKILHVYQEYEKAFQSGKKRSFEELGKKEKIHGAEVRKLLKVAHCPSLHWQVGNSPRVTDEEKRSIVAASALKMSQNDLVYFSDRSLAVFRAYGEKYTAAPLSHPVHPHNTRLTYRFASQVYEARDLGYSLNEMQELFGRPLHHILYVLEQYKKIAPRIIHALNTLHPRVFHKKPYRESKVS